MYLYIYINYGVSINRGVIYLRYLAVSFTLDIYHLAYSHRIYILIYLLPEPRLTRNLSLIKLSSLYFYIKDYFIYLIFFTLLYFLATLLYFLLVTSYL